MSKHKTTSFTGNNAWLKLQAKNTKPKKSRKRKNSDSEKLESTSSPKMEATDLIGSESVISNKKSTSRNPSWDIDEDDSKDKENLKINPEECLKVQSSKELLALLNDSSKVQKSKFDSSQWDEENIKLDDIQMAFGCEAAYGYALGWGKTVFINLLRV